MVPEGLRRLAQSLTRRQFAEKHPYHFLVLHSLGDSDQAANAFATQAVSSSPSPSSREISLLPISKSSQNPFQSHVSVGRARNCDLVIRHRSVSKLHARFRIDAEVLQLSDAGSQNGTFVNGKRLLPNEVVPVAPKDQLLFGSVAARTLDPGSVYDYLRDTA